MAGALSFCTVLPLWYVATRWTKVYTYLVFVVFISVLSYLVGRRIYRSIRDPDRNVSKRILKTLLKVLGVLLSVGFLYVIVWFIAQGWIYWAIPIIAVYLVLFGILLFRKSRTGELRRQ